MDSEPGSPSGRGKEIDARLEAVRARLKKLRERGRSDVQDWATASERVEAARRHAAEAHAAALEVLTASVEAFRRAAEAHERAASVHARAAAAGIGDVRQHEGQVALHQDAATADWQRAERAQLLLSESERAAPAPFREEPREGVTL